MEVLVQEVRLVTLGIINLQEYGENAGQVVLAAAVAAVEPDMPELV